EALRRSGDLKQGLLHLERASQLNAELSDALAAQALIHAELENWQVVIHLKQRLLESAVGEQRVRLLLDVGDVYHERLNERTQAYDQYLAALQESPDDRRILHKLMQLYSEAGEWSKLVDIVLKLAGFVDEPAQKAKYLETAGVVSALQMGEVKLPLEYDVRAFALSPSLKELDEEIQHYKEQRDHAAVERLLRLRLEVATKQDDSQELLSTFGALAELYERDLGDIDNAIDAYEAAQLLEPNNLRRAQLLAELYASDPTRFLDKAVKLHRSLLPLDPHRSDSYRMLR